jgi:hypothetical protein
MQDISIFNNIYIIHLSGQRETAASLWNTTRPKSIFKNGWELLSGRTGSDITGGAGAMIASKNWGPCCCNCGKAVNKGDEFTIVEGSMYLLGHEERRTRQMPAVSSKAKSPKEKSRKAAKGIADLPLFSGMEQE